MHCRMPSDMFFHFHFFVFNLVLEARNKKSGKFGHIAGNLYMKLKDDHCCTKDRRKASLPENFPTISQRLTFSLT